MNLHENAEGTRERLIEAAGELFAKNGFDGTSIRQICERANTNVAAIKYHFTNKQGLYEEMVLYAFHYMDRFKSLSLEGMTPPEQLRCFIRTKLENFLDYTRSAWHLQLIHGELKNQSSPLMEKVGELLEERLERLKRIVSAIVEIPVEDKRVTLYAFSVIGQCLFFARHAFIGRTSPVLKFYHTIDLDTLTEHIYSFSLAGMGVTDA